MGTLLRRLTDLFRHRPASPKKFPATGFKVLNHVQKLEEENWEWYTADTFYPIRIGEILRSRYQVVGKLGYGAHSTAWLCRDLPYVSRSKLQVPLYWLIPRAQCVQIRHSESLRTR